uniref:Acyl-CoA oxidase C-alpha1 domain-containing protein n=1 Tax=Lactuca sativa TaxID=4236 RepID=A0A9R1UYK5_LACSA|nr:hypothetical protein LSAT_V11C700371920 [Lactuca sativa]
MPGIPSWSKMDIPMNTVFNLFIKLCGGHRYLVSSGLPELFAVYIPTCTYEGDNVVLLLQVARFVVKIVFELGYKKPVGTTLGGFLGLFNGVSQDEIEIWALRDLKMMKWGEVAIDN